MKHFKCLVFVFLWITLLKTHGYPQTDTISKPNVLITAVDSTQIKPISEITEPEINNKKENKRIVAAILLITLTFFLIYNVRSK
jgi:hypothetical protein